MRYEWIQQPDIEYRLAGSEQSMLVPPFAESSLLRLFIPSEWRVAMGLRQVLPPVLRLNTNDVSRVDIAGAVQANSKVIFRVGFPELGRDGKLPEITFTRDSIAAGSEFASDTLQFNLLLLAGQLMQSRRNAEFRLDVINSFEGSFITSMLRTNAMSVVFRGELCEGEP